jgi:dipeptidyl aminopeptidase/acylaminoacyl peptidase
VRALARDVGPYRRASTWSGFRYDAVLVDLRDGTRRLAAEALQESVALSPGGRYVAWFEDGHWRLFDVERGTRRVLTEGLGVVFANEDHDRPSAPGSYGIAGWLEGDRALLVYDRFDVWQIPTEAGRVPVRLTDGRPGRWMLRVVRTDPERESFRDGEALLLHAYNDATKAEGFRRAHVGRTGTERLLDADRKYTFVAKADSADALLFTRQDYTEYPDLWLAGADLREPVRLTELDAQREGIAWGSAELVEWLSSDGRPLQGVLIRPGDYEPGKRYPVIVYFYELSSQRLHEFNEPVVNHRPSFPLYASNGYVIFLPDVRFEVGRPGLSAVKSLVPGVQKLIDMGIADPARIALHGHSWSGYQTAFVVTQTDIFRTAVAGAPVANMTSAYGGIRWGIGIARQHQYETGQSRLSGSLWEARDDYIDNSPLFFADRVRTPLLIIHGDDDDAVPWYQSIELYLALRRLDKPVVFLQYRDELHAPRKYANKLDWAMKMKEWFDHYLKDTPAPAWIAEGVPYPGK